MSAKEWNLIKYDSLASCAAIEKSIKLSEIASRDFGLSDNFNKLIDEHIEKIFSFIESYNLLSTLNVSNLHHKYSRRHETSGGFGNGLPGLSTKYSVVKLLINKIDMIYNSELITVEKVEHALILLDRKLLLLEEYNEKWKKVFKNSTEVGLEKLGALHLLESNIWAFKASGQRAETDLILQQEMDSFNSFVPLVMTEWKKANSSEDASTKIEEAKKQCEIYKSGILKPLQLDKHRFIVIVSLKKVCTDREIVEGSNKYLVRNIAIDRGTPSSEARI